MLQHTTSSFDLLRVCEGIHFAQEFLHRLCRKLEKELRPGAYILSNTFALQGKAPLANAGGILLYQMVRDLTLCSDLLILDREKVGKCKMRDDF